MKKRFRKKDPAVQQENTNLPAEPEQPTTVLSKAPLNAENAKKTHFYQQPRFRYGLTSTTLLCLFLALLIALNSLVTTLENKKGWRIDLSFNSITTTGDTTKEVLASLTKPVHIYALFSKGQEDAPLEELLNRYAAESELITWEEADISLNPALVTKFQGSTSDETISNDSLIVYCPENDRWRILSPSDFVTVGLNTEEGTMKVSGLAYENKITSAIDYVSKETVPRLIIVQGHGELDEDGTEVFASLLKDNNYQVVFSRLTASDLNLTEDDLVMLLSPANDLSDAEMTLLTDFCQKGGNLFLTCDYTDDVDSMPNLLALMRSYGFIPKTGVVVASAEEPDTYYDNYRIDLIPTLESTDLTQTLLENNYYTLLLTGTRAFETPEDADRNLTVQTLLSSSEKAYLKDIASGNLTTLDQTETDETGPFALALQATRVTTEGYVSKAVILGCSTLLTSSQVHSMTDAQEFILTIMNYLAGDSSSLGILAKEAYRPQLSVRSTRMGSLMLVILPLAVLAAALIVLLPRLRR